MPVDRITSADDPRVHDYRAVREPELVRRRGLFIAEGRLVVARLLALPHLRIRSILLSAANAERPLPRPPLPTQPVATDPYAIPEKD